MELGFRCPFCEKIRMESHPELSKDDLDRETIKQVVGPMYAQHIRDHVDEICLEVARAGYNRD